jgi:signal transduction histidine kinase
LSPYFNLDEVYLNMKSVLKKNLINITVALISVLLIADIIFTYINNEIIKHNRELQINAETIKLYAEQIGKSTIHGIDIGLRGYVIDRDPQFFTPVDSAIYRRDSILQNVEIPLKKQGYDLAEFYALRDSLDGYIAFCLDLKKLLDTGKDEEFRQKFHGDKGLFLWWQYLMFVRHVGAYEDNINREAQQRYESALRNNYILQIALFFICFPTLLYTAYYSKRTNKYLELLRVAESDKNEILREQNRKLEQMVAERTQEITAQNEELVQQQEEIATQRDTLSDQNKKLHDAQKVIEDQNKEIQNENERLENEVSKRTQELREANKELINQNNQLEQFAFISAHNLRAPLARILGLAHILEISNEAEEKENILQKITSSVNELDRVIKDLNVILDIRKNAGHLLTNIDLRDVVRKVSTSFEKECKETNAVIQTDFTRGSSVYAVLPYVESIIHNLINNAIKYRNPEKDPVIEISTTTDQEFVCLSIKDNGLGIDLEKYGQDVFSLYKRFHLHVDGKGLGLYLVKSQITALGGNVEIESAPYKGTTFNVYFKK